MGTTIHYRCCLVPTQGIETHNQELDLYFEANFNWFWFLCAKVHSTENNSFRWKLYCWFCFCYFCPDMQRIFSNGELVGLVFGTDVKLVQTNHMLFWDRNSYEPVKTWGTLHLYYFFKGTNTIHRTLYMYCLLLVILLFVLNRTTVRKKTFWI